MTKQRVKLEDYAAKPVLVFSGSLLVLSIALNNVGFKEVVDAYAKSIVYKIEQEKMCYGKIPKEIDDRLKQLEINSHKPNK